MFILSNPAYRPDARDLRTLEKDVREDILRIKPRTLRPYARVKITKEIGENAASVLLDQLRPKHSVVDTNKEIKMNYPGSDFIIDNRIRVQVKASPFVELIGWSHKDKMDHPSMNYDVLIYVDIGCMIDARVGRLADIAGEPSDSVDYYVFPASVIKIWSTRIPQNIGRRRFDAWRHTGKGIQDMFNYRNRFEVLTCML